VDVPEEDAGHDRPLPDRATEKRPPGFHLAAGWYEPGMTSRGHEIDSTDEHEDREGETLVTRDHDVIRQWAEDRDGEPATVAGTGEGDELRTLLIDFGQREDRLETVEWEAWFETFDERGLEFAYQEHKADGSTSTFFRLRRRNGS
jgi:hypothetical protein